MILVDVVACVDDLVTHTISDAGCSVYGGAWVALVLEPPGASRCCGGAERMSLRRGHFSFSAKLLAHTRINAHHRRHVYRVVVPAEHGVA